MVSFYFAATSALVLLFPLTVVVVEGGIQPFDLILPPTETLVHYNDGYIRAPGFIDLKGLTFTALSESFVAYADDEFGMDDPPMKDATDDETDMNNANDDEPPRQNRRQQQEQRQLDGGVGDGDTEVDVAVFRLPPSCVNSRNGCDWDKLGVGVKSSDDGSVRWCCSQEAIDLGVCDEEVTGYGRLMLNKTLFAAAQGEHRFVTVPPQGEMAKSIRFGHIEVKVSGTYVVLYANCNDRGREVHVTGESVWKSEHGYLPGELYGFMYFFIAVTVLYFFIMVWYGICMRANEESRIEIEKWIFLAICLGLLEMIFRSADYIVWNVDGSRSTFVVWIGILAGVLKQGISRCLIVMVSLGWGVVRDSLGSTMRIIVVLGATYIALSAVRDMLIVFGIEDMNTLSIEEEEHIFGVVRIVTFLVSVIDVIFIMWILDALNNTMLYLENMNQTRKLERYLKLRCYFMFSIMFAVIWSVFSLVNTVNDVGVMEEQNAWALDASTEINYLFVLISVACLWRPNPNAREYAYVMELPSCGADADNELELTGVVPSAADSDDGQDDFGPTKNESDDDDYDNDHHDNRFQIT